MFIREHWQPRSYTDKNKREYPCPKCKAGILKRVSHNIQITKEGQDYSEYPNYPYGILHRFSGIWQCSDSSCGHICTVSGDVLKDVEGVGELPTGEYIPEYYNEVRPKYFYPNLRMFELPDDLGKETTEHLDKSFANYFADLTSSANRLRSAVESLLNDIKAPAKRKTKKGMKQFETLHGRLEHLRKSKPRIAELLLAIKVIGNEGSHLGKLSEDDLLDGYQIFAEVLDILFFKRGAKTLATAKEINTRKKPRSKK